MILTSTKPTKQEKPQGKKPVQLMVQRMATMLVIRKDTEKQKWTSKDKSSAV